MCCLVHCATRQCLCAARLYLCERIIICDMDGSLSPPPISLSPSPSLSAHAYGYCRNIFVYIFLCNARVGTARVSVFLVRVMRARATSEKKYILVYFYPFEVAKHLRPKWAQRTNDRTTTNHFHVIYVLRSHHLSLDFILSPIWWISIRPTSSEWCE